MIRLVQIVPRLPPNLDGVGDYARVLAGKLRDDFGVATRFIVGDPLWPGPPVEFPFPAVVVPQRTDKHLAALLAPDAAGEVILLHYVGYGYHRRGIPFWMISGLDRIPRRSHKLVVFFHELWSVGPPWSSVFWLRWVQWWLIQKLRHRADCCLTSTPRMAQWLKTDSSVMTIPSPFLPTVNRPSLNARRQPPWSIIVFGLTHTRLRALQAHANLIRNLNQCGDLQRILVVGHAAKGGDAPSDDVRYLTQMVAHDKVCVRASCDDHAVVSSFQEASFYLTFYPPELAGKSSSFTTSLACGCPAVFHQEGDASPLKAGKEYLVCDGTRMGVRRFMQEAGQGKLSAVGAAGLAWYCKYADWPVLARRYIKLLRPLTDSV